MAIRTAIFNDWVDTFNFTGLETGLINGAGFTGFCFGIIIGGIVVDKVGYENWWWPRSSSTCCRLS